MTSVEPNRLDWTPEQITAAAEHLSTSRSGVATNRILLTSYPTLLAASAAMAEAYDKWESRADGGEDDLHYAARKLWDAIALANGVPPNAGDT